MMKSAVNGFLVGSLLVLVSFFIAPSAQCSTMDTLSFENLTQDVGRGFGDTWNRYAWSMEELGGKVYVGTWSVSLDIAGIFSAVSSGDIDFSGTGDPLSLMYTFMKSTGGEIWRNDGGTNWEQVYDAEPDEVGFRKMVTVEHDGTQTLYVGSVNSEGCKILYSSTGNETDWDTLEGGPMDNPENVSIRAMIAQDGMLIVGTENNSNSGGELWVYNPNNTNGATVNGSEWCQIGAGEFDGDPSLAELAFYNGELYVGTWDFDDKFKLFKVCEADGGYNVNDVTPIFDGCDDLSNLGVMKLIEYDGRLYLGTVNYENGFTLLCTEDTSDRNGWTVITTNGLGDPSNAYSWAMEEWNDKLYLGTFNDGLFSGIYDPVPIPLDGRGQLWCSDGTNWSQVVDDGFGSRFNYGIRTMTVTSDNRLVLGTASNMMIPDPSIINPYFMSLLGNIDGVDITALSSQLASLSSDNWIGAEVWATKNGSQAPVPEPATILLLGIGLAGLAKFRIKFNKG
ncbi:MAG TPA: PEP-CTERM sorting domain-containing protein [Deltaproteobacteria bacterium]|nr:PEP-CTERM sorting domain-containing protein [Deltaproteobacteria bacterium]